MSRIGGVEISHPERTIFRVPLMTKGELARYYEAVAARMLPHVAGRPLTLLRCLRPIEPGAGRGGCFIVRHGKTWERSTLRRVFIEEVNKTDEYMVVDDRVDLVSLVQLGAVEIHTWNGYAESPYRHDRVVFDLDPGPSVAWAEVVACAHGLHGILNDLGLRAWVKTTGGRGLHVFVPIEPVGWRACVELSRTVAERLVADAPERRTLSLPKRGREDKIFVDVLRNNRASTAVAAYSVRARPGAPVSAPLTWDELTPRLRADSFTTSRLLERLSDDPWSGYWQARQRLPEEGPKGPSTHPPVERASTSRVPRGLRRDR
jgi:bifunctional non-homologous end joining protein LigD